MVADPEDGDVLIVTVPRTGKVWGVFSSRERMQAAIDHHGDRNTIYHIQTFQVDYRWRHRRRIARALASAGSVTQTARDGHAS